jgi:hypothetical protein
MIDSLLLANNFFPGVSTAGISDTLILTYDGLTSFLDYKIRDSAQIRLQCLNQSSVVPKNILYISDWLDTLIFRTVDHKTDSFSMGTYLDTLKMISSKDVPPTPGKLVRFVSPKTKH